MSKISLSITSECVDCLYEDCDCVHERCIKCKRNNLSGYYKDLYVSVYDVDSFIGTPSMCNIGDYERAGTNPKPVRPLPRVSKNG